MEPHMEMCVCIMILNVFNKTFIQEQAYVQEIKQIESFVLGIELINKLVKFASCGCAISLSILQGIILTIIIGVKKPITPLVCLLWMSLW